MIRRHNGFTWFMKKLDGKELGIFGFTTPGYWSPAAIRRCLSDVETTGDVSCLLSCFEWKSTPQGSSYWENIYTGTTVITKEDLEYLYWLQEQER